MKNIRKDAYFRLYLRKSYYLLYPLNNNIDLQRALYYSFACRLFCLHVAINVLFRDIFRELKIYKFLDFIEKKLDYYIN